MFCCWYVVFFSVFPLHLLVLIILVAQQLEPGILDLRETEMAILKYGQLTAQVGHVGIFLMYNEAMGAAWGLRSHILQIKEFTRKVFGDNLFWIGVES